MSLAYTVKAKARLKVFFQEVHGTFLRYMLFEIQKKVRFFVGS